MHQCKKTRWSYKELNLFYILTDYYHAETGNENKVKKHVGEDEYIQDNQILSSNYNE